MNFEDKICFYTLQDGVVDGAIIEEKEVNDETFMSVVEDIVDVITSELYEM
jgi:hypothetical protein